MRVSYDLEMRAKAKAKGGGLVTIAIEHPERGGRTIIQGGATAAVAKIADAAIDAILAEWKKGSDG